MFRVEPVLVALALVVGCKSKPAEPVAAAAPALHAVGPRVIANDTAYPLYLYGEGFVENMELELQSKRFAVRRLSPTLAAATVEGLVVPEADSLTTLNATLHAGVKPAGTSPLTVVNDADYPWPYALAVIGGEVFVASPTTDTVWHYDAKTPPVAIPVGDRPRALAHYNDGAKDWLVVVHELDGRILLLDTAAPTAKPRTIESRAQAQDIEVQGSTAYITNRLTDRVHIIDLAAGKEVASWPVGENPRAIASGGGKLAVSNLNGDNLVLLDPATGARTEVIVGPSARIVGGHTEPFSDSVMGLKAPRDIVWSPKHQVFLAATLGPNIGPNDQRMEISMNSGVSVIEAGGTFRHHVSMLRGNAEHIALDEQNDIVLAADISRGRVVAFDLTALLAGDSGAVVAQLFIEPPATTRPLRPAADHGVDRRATLSMYSGPAAIVLDGGFAYVLNRFTGTVSKIDYAEAAVGGLRVVATFAAPDLGQQIQRRGGEVVFYTDLGDSRMSCDTCHHEGHNSGILFTKSSPMHIYRTTSLRSISETAPYFTPAGFPSLAKISHFVLARNRLKNGPPSLDEVAALTLYQRTLAPPPNPYVGEQVELPNGEHGNVVAGAALFAANCSGCHPPPMFTPDQAVETRGKLYDTGDVTIPLRPDQQDATPYPVPVPTLVGVWDNHPLFHGGQVGNKLQDGRVVPTPFALADVLDRSNHFDATKLDNRARSDLLAYVLTL